MSMENVLWFEEIGAEDSEKVGEKNANLGELQNNVEVPVLPGFATTISAYEQFITETGLKEKIETILSDLDTGDVKDLQMRGRQIRTHIKSADMPQGLRNDFAQSYEELENRLGVKNPEVAVRPSATGLEMSETSFAGQQNAYLNVSGKQELIKRIKDCFASLFTNRAISYREANDLNHFDLKLGVAVQKMGRSDTGASGVMFTLDPDSGFENVVTVNASYGLGDYVVNGEINPDEFTVFKESLGIIEKKLGEKESKLVKNRLEEEDTRNKEVKVPQAEREKFCITDNQVKEIAKYGLRIEEHYGKPMDIEWLLDGETKQLYIVQARPETVQAERDTNIIEDHRLLEESNVILEGEAVGSRIGSGKAHVLNSAKQIDQFEEGQVLVTDMTDPDWEPIMEKAAAIITNKGGRTSHAAIIARELGIPAVIGTETATTKIPNKKQVTVDCTTSNGKIWDSQLQHESKEHHLEKIPETETDIQINVEEPSEAFKLAQLPVDGVGLVTQKHIIKNHVGEHPLKLIQEERQDEYIEALRSGLGKIAAAFYPRQVNIQLSDLKTSEYSELEGGQEFELEESNPLLGLRGASRHSNKVFAQAFELECRALRRTIDELGLDNITIVVPFCRSIEEGKKVRAKMKEYGLDKGDIDVHLMAETPANIIQLEAFSELFDGFSAGINDLTRLTLGVDLENEKLKDAFDETDPAVKYSVSMLVSEAHRNHLSIGICGDATSAHEEYIEFLVGQGVDSISVSPEKALETVMKAAEAEEREEGSERKTPEALNREKVGEAAGQVYEALNRHGDATATKLKTYTSRLNDSMREQALGWLAREEKIEVDKEEGEIRYRLKD